MEMTNQPQSFKISIAVLRDNVQKRRSLETEAKKLRRDICERFSKYQPGQIFESVDSGRRYQMFRTDVVYKDGLPIDLQYTCNFLLPSGRIDKRIRDYFPIKEESIASGKFRLV